MIFTGYILEETKRKMLQDGDINSNNVFKMQDGSY